MKSNAKTILIIGHVWPEPNSSAAGSRMMQLIDLFLSQGMNVIFCSPALATPFSSNLKIHGIQTAHVTINDPSFDEFLRAINPDWVLFDRFMIEEKFGWRVAEICPSALRILDTEDLHCLRYARQESVKKQIQFQLNTVKNDLAKREIASILRSDVSLIISMFEFQLLKETFKIDEQFLYYLPFLIDTTTTPNPIGFDKRKHFVSIGNFLHEPNKDAVFHLNKHIWPIIRKKLPDAEVHIYGAYLPESVAKLNNSREGFLIKGRAEHAQQVITSAKVLLAPLRFGAGLKGKLLEAMQYGTPSVTTEIGAEGMTKDLLWNGYIESESGKFADSAVELYLNQEKWAQAQNNGFQLLNLLFDKELFMNKFLIRLMGIFETLQTHREMNFTGSMLMHHQLQSTKYFSRWIEEKNKKGNT